MKRKRIPAVVIIAVSLALAVLAVLGGGVISAQDAGQAKYTVRVPNGLAFSEFRGYEGWQTVSISQNDKLVAVILANPEETETWREGAETWRVLRTYFPGSIATHCLVQDFFFGEDLMLRATTTARMSLEAFPRPS